MFIEGLAPKDGLTPEQRRDHFALSGSSRQALTGQIVLPSTRPDLAGYIANVSTANGIYSNGWGENFTGLAVPGGYIMMAEYNAGVIKHKLGVCIASTDGNSCAGPVTTAVP